MYKYLVFTVTLKSRNLMLFSIAESISATPLRVVRLKHFGNGKGNYFVVSVMCSICIKIAVVSNSKILNLELNLKCGNQIHPESI